MLGEIEKVELRSIWKHEALDFTQWLAKPENINRLANEIGIQMEVLQTEANVGSFSADILAEEVSTGKKIIIENQLEMTDHDHLGKLITYASGLDASYIIWIFKDIREEHRRAIDWLNEVTDEGLNIFAIKMEVWKIGDSLPAPVFRVIASPNDWQKAYKRRIASSQELNDTANLQLQFWEGFVEYFQANKSPFRMHKASARGYYDISIGSSQVIISCTLVARESFVRVALYIRDDKEFYNRLWERKDEIEAFVEFPLEWQNNPNAKSCFIGVKKDVTDLANEVERNETYAWMMDRAVMIYQTVKEDLPI